VKALVLFYIDNSFFYDTMHPNIKEFSERKIIGITTTILKHEQHKIRELWQQFMPRKHDIQSLSSQELIAMQIFNLEENGTPREAFEIWACAEVMDFDTIPNHMKAYTIPSGTYAIFPHKGMDAGSTYQNIMSEWLPTSGYEIDNRPHFQVMGEKYKNGSADSEEDFYVPVRLIKN